jgi:hypothetical protein
LGSRTAWLAPFRNSFARFSVVFADLVVAFAISFTSLSSIDH